jgi:membrane protease YdiL (CAAX protease family)
MTRGATDAAAADAIPVAAAVSLMPVALLLLVLVGSLLVPSGLGGVAATQVLCFALPAYLAARLAAGARAPRALGLTRPRARALLGALLLGASFWYLSIRLVAPLSARWMSNREAAELGRDLAAPDPLLWKLTVMALLPALCEELLVRGAIARGLRARLGSTGAVVASAAYFALLHGSPARALPAGVFGLVLAAVALRSGSTFTSALVHACNNLVIVVMAQPAGAPAAALLDEHPIATTVAAAAVSLVGGALVWRRDVSRATSL